MTAHGRVPFVCGNWKMTHGLAATRTQVKALVDGVAGLKGVDVAVAPVGLFLQAASELIGSGSKLHLAAQNVHFADKGAFTGEWSVGHLKELNVQYVIVGHSERRAMFADNNETVPKKVRAVLDGGLLPIACIGETLSQRENGKTKHVVTEETCAILEVVQQNECAKLTLAYEPVWAIGTGKVATPEQAQDVHALIRSLLVKRFGADGEKVRIQYGGSVKPDNAKELMSMPDVDGALVGGASLEAASLIAIARAASGS